MKISKKELEMILKAVNKEEELDETLPLSIFESSIYKKKIDRAIEWLDANDHNYVVKKDGCGDRLVKCRLTLHELVLIRNYIYQDDTSHLERDVII